MYLNVIQTHIAIDVEGPLTALTAVTPCASIPVFRTELHYYYYYYISGLENRD
jgi:hypothetical protein